MADTYVKPIAVVGVGALFPGSETAGGFWDNILDGVDLIDDVPEGRWRLDDYYDEDQSVPDKTYARRGGFLDFVGFDPLKYGIPPNIVEATDTSQLLALIVAQQVLDDAARGQFDEMDRDRISVVLGVTSGQELMNEMAGRLHRPIWQKALREVGLPESEVQQACQKISDHFVDWQESTFPGLLGNVVAGRIANRFDLGGTNCVTDAACASTLSALSMGLNELYLGHSDVVIAGGVDTFNDIFMYMCFSKTPALSLSGDVRPFSDQADGTMLGEGLAMFALKRLEDAERDGDEIYALIRGIGSSSDGRSKSIYAPLSEGQAKALRRAYDRAGYGPDTVELIEAHGTGTKAGDAAEIGGLRQVFDETGRDDPQWCALGSVKSQVGHTKAAAGAAGLFKVVMALHHKVLPPTIKVDRPNPKLDLETSPLYINTVRRPWIRGTDHPRRGSVSAFGFGGSNFHVTAEEYVGEHQKPRYRHTPTELILLGDAAPETLAVRCEALAGEIDGEPLDRVAKRTHDEYDGGHVRLAVVAETTEDLQRKLSQAADSIRSAGEDGFALPNGLYYGVGEHDGDVAFLFPGQGSQYVDMGSDLAQEFDDARRVWDAAADLDFGSEQLHRVVFPPPAFTDETREAQANKLRQTDWAQPALGAASLATLRILDTVGLKADAVAGHSFGEITALCAAGVIDDQQMLRIARRRGELMAEAAEQTEGAMCAVAAAADDVQALLDGWESTVVVANRNSPRQTVLSGAVDAIADVERRLAAQEISFTRLNVATAFHSPIVAASADPFGEFLSDIDFGSGSATVWANVSGEAYSDDADEMRDTLRSQIASPVQFQPMIERMVDSGITTFVEVGPGTVLTRLCRRIAGDNAACVSTDAKGRDGLTALWHCLGELAARGVAFDLRPLWTGRFVTPEAGPAPKLTIDIWGGNHNRPYPPIDGELPAPNPPRAAQAPKAPSKPTAPQPDEMPSMSNNDQPKYPATSQPQQPQAATPAAAPDAAWVYAFQESQRQMANAHAAYQQAMAQSHTAFLSAVSNSQANLTSMLTGAAPVAHAQAPAPQQTFAAPQPPAPSPQHFAPPQPPAPVAQPQHFAPPQPQTSAPRPTPAPAAAPLPSAPAPTMAAPQDIDTLLLEVVSQKTGYPAEMLDLDMQLEADLGIDSIKRVEILSAVQDAAPHLPDVDGSEMSQLSTLREIVDFLGGLTDAPAAAAPPAIAPKTPAGAAPTKPAPTPAPVPEPAATASTDDIEHILLDAVADKTGYPVEMLELDMQLEADLGIDSIKRVEILSAVNEALPELPEVDGSDMANLGTLREILDFMSASVDEKKNFRPTA